MAFCYTVFNIYFNKSYSTGNYRYLLYKINFYNYIYSINNISNTLIIYIYIKYKFVKNDANILNEIVYASISLLICGLLTVFFIFFYDSYYLKQYFDKKIINCLLILAIIPNIVILIQYVKSTIKNHLKINHKIITALLITSIGITLDILLDSLFFVSGSFALAAVALFINKYEMLLNTDTLTGLSNIRELSTYIDNIKPNTLTAAFFMDVDKFKMINDKYGHQEGDKLLKNVAKIVKNSSRETDLVARNGGDEFLILAKINNKSDADIIYNRIQKNIKDYNKLSKHKLSISIGWDIYESEEKSTTEDFNDFLDKLDNKMYKEKILHHKKK